jgi:ATPase family AAA domain-containing protein 1
MSSTWILSSFLGSTEVIAAEIVLPDDITVKFTGENVFASALVCTASYNSLLDIGGLDPIISSLRESVIYPLLYPTLFKSSDSDSTSSDADSNTSSLFVAPKGVLLHGPPGMYSCYFVENP